VREALLPDQAVCLSARVAKIAAPKDDAGPQAPAGGDLDEGGELRHHHGHGDPKELPVVRQPEGVVAGGGGDNPLSPALLGQHEERIAGPPLLERACPLEVVELAHDAGTGDLAEGYG